MMSDAAAAGAVVQWRAMIDSHTAGAPGDATQSEVGIKDAYTGMRMGQHVSLSSYYERVRAALDAFDLRDIARPAEEEIALRFM